MATAGCGRVARFMTGSVTDKVVLAAPCPVLTLHPHDRAEDAAPLTTRQRLIQHGCAVVEGWDAESATRAVADPSNVFDVILLDYRLPDAHGLELLTIVKQFAPRSSVVMVSSEISAGDLAEARRRGASACVPKPFDLDDVWTLVRRYGHLSD